MLQWLLASCSTAQHYVAPGVAHVKGVFNSPEPITTSEQKKSTAAVLPPHPTALSGRALLAPSDPASKDTLTGSDLGDRGLIGPADSPISRVHKYNINRANDNCVICHIKDRATILAPCGHYAMCK